MSWTATARPTSPRTCTVFYPACLPWGTSTTPSAPSSATLGFCSTAAVERKSTPMTLSSGMKRYWIHFPFALLVKKCTYTPHRCNIFPHVLEEHVLLVFGHLWSSSPVMLQQNFWGRRNRVWAGHQTQRGVALPLCSFRYGDILLKNTNLCECMQLSMMCISTLATGQSTRRWFETLYRHFFTIYYCWLNVCLPNASFRSLPRATR